MGHEGDTLGFEGNILDKEVVRLNRSPQIGGRNAHITEEDMRGSAGFWLESILSRRNLYSHTVKSAMITSATFWLEDVMGVEI